MRTNRERTSRGHQTYNRESGVVGLILLALIVVAIAVAAFLFVARKQDKTATTDTQSTAGTSDGEFPEATPLQRNQVNTQRRVDAAELLSAATEYANNNMGSLPRQIYSYMTQGFDYYDSASLAIGAQKPITTDELRLVIGATCTQDGSTVAGSARQIAVQYGVHDANDSTVFNPECKEA